MKILRKEINYYGGYSYGGGYKYLWFWFSNYTESTIVPYRFSITFRILFPKVFHISLFRKNIVTLLEKK